MATASSATVRSQEVPEFPRAAAAYALKELARRAGVSADFYRAWRIETDDVGFVNVFVEPGTRKRIRFSQATPEFWKQVRAGIFRASRASWMWRPGKFSTLVPDFCIPFSSSDKEEIGRLFSILDNDCVECSVDILAATMLTLARFEETLPSPKDEHGRFSALSSFAWRDRFLDRPVIDELGLALEQALSHLLPRWRPQERRLRIKLSHDVDEIGLPFTLHGAIGHFARRGHPGWAMRDLLAPVMHIETTYQRLLRQIVALSIERGIKPAVHWKASAPGPNDTGYNPRHRAIRSMIEDFRDEGVEMGIHPGYETYQSRETLSAEVSVLQEFFGKRQLGGRQDFLRWNPQTWIDWESLGLAYDSSVGFADRIGFRAGTCYPFRPWILSEHREAKLLEIPLLAMDETFYSHQKLEPGETLVKLRELVARCSAVGGVFTLLWHNTRIVHRGFLRAYQTLLDELSGTDNYHWETDYDRGFDAC
jgi:uncharacterized protein DUF7033